MPPTLNLRSPAKLNLFLHVTGRRSDGYHLLESVFVPIDWCDRLAIEVRADGRLKRHDLGARLPEDDLCMRAARLLQAHTGCRLGADLFIDKQVPWGAGLGGGSANAATVLKALNRHWRLDLPRPELDRLALQLGADVPFFIEGRPAWVSGIGEQIEPLALPADVLATPVAVLKPPVAVPTVAIFGSSQLSRNTPRATVAAFLAAPRRFGHNDLQGPAQAYSSEVTQALALMESRFGNSRMTGSGSAVFSWVSPEHDHPPAPPSFSAAGLGLVNPASWSARLCRVLADVDELE